MRCRLATGALIGAEQKAASDGALRGPIGLRFRGKAARSRFFYKCQGPWSVWRSIRSTIKKTGLPVIAPWKIR